MPRSNVNRRSWSLGSQVCQKLPEIVRSRAAWPDTRVRAVRADDKRRRHGASTQVPSPVYTYQHARENGELPRLKLWREERLPRLSPASTQVELVAQLPTDNRAVDAAHVANQSLRVRRIPLPTDRGVPASEDIEAEHLQARVRCALRLVAAQQLTISKPTSAAKSHSSPSAAAVTFLCVGVDDTPGGTDAPGSPAYDSASAAVPPTLRYAGAASLATPRNAALRSPSPRSSPCVNSVASKVNDAKRGSRWLTAVLASTDTVALRAIDL